MSLTTTMCLVLTTMSISSGAGSRTMKSRGTIIFLGGLGAPRASTQIHHGLGGRGWVQTISIDMPSHGTLSAVTFSLARCERVLLRVLRRASSHSSSSFPQEDFSRAFPCRIKRCRDLSVAEMSINIDPVLIAAYGPGAQAAMHVASRRPDLVAGLFLSTRC